MYCYVTFYLSSSFIVNVMLIIELFDFIVHCSTVILYIYECVDVLTINREIVILTIHRNT